MEMINPQDIALSADRVDGCAGCDNIVGADEVAQRARGVLTGKNRDGIDAQQLGCLNVHTGEHNVGPQSGAGDKGAERADEDSRRAFQKDRHEDTDDDELGTAVFSGKLCDRSLYVLNGTGGFEGVQNGKGAEDHDDDLEAFLEALPDARVQDSNIILQAQVCDIEIGQSEEHSPQKCDRRDVCRRHTKGHDPDQYNGDRTDCKNKLIILSPSIATGLIKCVFRGRSHGSYTMKKSLTEESAGAASYSRGHPHSRYGRLPFRLQAGHTPRYALLRPHR